MIHPAQKTPIFQTHGFCRRFPTRGPMSFLSPSPILLLPTHPLHPTTKEEDTFRTHGEPSPRTQLAKERPAVQTPCAQDTQTLLQGRRGRSDVSRRHCRRPSARGVISCGSHKLRQRLGSSDHDDLHRVRDRLVPFPLVAVGVGVRLGWRTQHQP